MKEQLDVLTLPELYNLFFKETVEFTASIGKETSEQMEDRRSRIKLIDLAIEAHKNGKQKALKA